MTARRPPQRTIEDVGGDRDDFGIECEGPRSTAPRALPGAIQRRLNLPWYGGALPMVHPGGKITMLGHWRMVLRQAEEAARAGRFDEALALVTRPDVADHHHAVKLRGRFVLDLIARASRRGGADDT